MRVGLLDELKKALPGFQVFYFPTLRGYDDEANPVGFHLSHGPAIFVKKSLTIISHQDYIINKADPNFGPKKDFSNLTTPLQYIRLIYNGKQYSIFNFHGNPFPSNKLDSENRIKESGKVRDIVSGKENPKIIVGDFNLLPETKSLTIIGEGMRNLIREYNIERTRSNLSPFFGKEDFQKFADYTFVTNDVIVKNFQVPEVEISDHLPMILEFD